MELKNLNAIIELLGPQEFGEFKDEIRRQLQEETEGDLAQKEKEIKAYRTTLVNFARHALQILIHYDIPLDKLEKKIESLTPAPTPASEYPLSVIHPAPASTSTPIEIPPAIKEVLRPSAKPSSKPKPPSKHSPDRAKPVMSEARDRQLIYEGIITCLSATGNPKIGVYFEDILIYLEKVIGAGRARRISAPGCRGSLPCSRPLPTGCIYSRRGSGLRASGGLGISTCSESHLGERPG